MVRNNVVAIFRYRRPGLRIRPRTLFATAINVR